ncbi:MAG: response regulator transcription factor [Chitinophagales bacterium]|nr:response regulator transcription factor [Chitinophagales bacterium]
MKTTLLKLIISIAFGIVIGGILGFVISEKKYFLFNKDLGLVETFKEYTNIRIVKQYFNKNLGLASGFVTTGLLIIILLSPELINQRKRLIRLSKTEKIKVIITDDHKIFRTGVKNGILKYPNISVIGEAGNGKELLGILETIQPDIILLDLQMPVMDGLAALPIIKEKYPFIKVIILTMHNDASIVNKMIELGANSYLTLEANNEEIYNTIITCNAYGFHITEIMKKAIAIIYERNNS